MAARYDAAVHIPYSACHPASEITEEGVHRSRNVRLTTDPVHRVQPVESGKSEFNRILSDEDL